MPATASCSSDVTFFREKCAIDCPGDAAKRTRRVGGDPLAPRQASSTTLVTYSATARSQAPCPRGRQTRRFSWTCVTPRALSSACSARLLVRVAVVEGAGETASHVPVTLCRAGKVGTCACRRARSRIPAPRRTSSPSSHQEPSDRPGRVRLLDRLSGSNPTRGTPAQKASRLVVVVAAVAADEARAAATPRRARAARARAHGAARPVLHEHRDVRERVDFHGRSAVNRSARNAQTFGSVSERLARKTFSFFFSSSLLGSRRLLWDGLRREETVASRRRDRRRLSSRPDRFDRFDFLHRARGRTPSPRPSTAGRRRRRPPAPSRRRRRRRLRRPPRRRFSKPIAAARGAETQRVRRARQLCRLHHQVRAQPFRPTRAVHHQNGPAPGRRVFFGVFRVFFGVLALSNRAHARVSRSRLAAYAAGSSRARVGPTKKAASGARRRSHRSEKHAGEPTAGMGSSKTLGVSTRLARRTGGSRSPRPGPRRDPGRTGWRSPRPARACFYPTPGHRRRTPRWVCPRTGDPSWTRPPPRWSPGGHPESASCHRAGPQWRGRPSHARPRSDRAFARSVVFFAKFCGALFAQTGVVASNVALGTTARAAVGGWRCLRPARFGEHDLERRLGIPGVGRCFSSMSVGQPTPLTHPHLMGVGELTPGFSAREWRPNAAAPRREAPTSFRGAPRGCFARAPAELGDIPYPRTVPGRRLRVPHGRAPAGLRGDGGPRIGSALNLFLAASRPRSERQETWNGAHLCANAAIEYFGADEAFERGSERPARF